MAFSGAVKPADRLVDLYRQLPVEVLDALPQRELETIKREVGRDLGYFEQILKFPPGKTTDERDARIRELEGSYNAAFQALHPLISYGVRKSTDFAKLEREARDINARMGESLKQAEQVKTKVEEETTKLLELVRKSAAEQGVSQQAIYFKDEAGQHDRQAKHWLLLTFGVTVVLGLYAASALFLHKWSPLAPTNAYEAVQLGVGKILLFVTISFLAALCAKNFLAHTHNRVVNRHRHNALLTYRTLVEAASGEANRDIVLTKAADCIFAPQSTGFSKPEVGGAGEGPIISVPTIIRTLTEGTRNS